MKLSTNEIINDRLMVSNPLLYEFEHLPSGVAGLQVCGRRQAEFELACLCFYQA